VMMINTPLWDI